MQLPATGSMTEWLSVFSDNCAKSQHNIQTPCSSASRGGIMNKPVAGLLYVYEEVCGS